MKIKSLKQLTEDREQRKLALKVGEDKSDPLPNLNYRENLMSNVTNIKPKFDIFEVPLVKSRRFGAAGAGRPRGSIYPVADLGIGQAFFVEAAADADVAKLVKTVQSSVVRLAKPLKYKLAVRNLPGVGVDEEGNSLDAETNPWGVAGVGVWRIPGEYVHKPRAPKAEAA
jgi:hypothetical protein